MSLSSLTKEELVRRTIEAQSALAGAREKIQEVEALAEARQVDRAAAEDRYQKAEAKVAVMVPEAAALAGCIRALDALPQTRRNDGYYVSGLTADQSDRSTVERILRSLASKYSINLIEREIAPCDRVHLDDAGPALIADAFARMVRS